MRTSLTFDSLACLILLGSIYDSNGIDFIFGVMLLKTDFLSFDFLRPLCVRTDGVLNVTIYTKMV